MGFSLAGFAAGLSESIVERIEEERKFSNLALQGRIERASVLKQQQDKEAAAIEQELRQRKSALEEFGVNDPELQKAYLTAPTAFEALQKAKLSGMDVDPAKLVTINKEKLFSGTPDELIRNAARPTAQIEPAKLLQTEGGSMLAPSQRQQERRFEQLASMRGLTREDVARAEAGTRPQMPQVAASINFDVLKKPEKLDWKQQLTQFETAYAGAEFKFGKNSPEAIRAKNDLEGYRTVTRELNDEQFDHTKNMSRANAILSDPSKATKEQIDWATKYRGNYDAYRKEQEAKGKQDEKMPSETSLISIARTGAGNYLRKQYPGNKDFKNIPVKDAAGNVIGEQYTYAGPRKPEIDRAIAAEEQRGAIAVLRPYMVDGRVTDRRVETALLAFGIELDKDKRPIMPTTPPLSVTQEPTAGDRRAQPGGATATPAAATPIPAPTAAPPAAPGPGRAGQGAAKPVATKVMTMADVAATATATGKTEQEVIDAATRKGYTIQR
jgi:hypothetical protein